ncbi:MAG: PEGA domain-containing protein, partial [Spirochaetaceae bacterium]|nr:PEGA domain-containing protein [Spirochaetaceae bacterium]
KIRVRERRLTAVNVQLAQEPGSLILDSDPSGAEVLIDGKASGTTPLRLSQIQPGSYRVTIKKDLYLDYSATITVRSREERTLNATMTIMPGTVRITSAPSGAELRDGDKVIGKTPITLTDLPPRKYVYQLVLQDYVVYPLDINVEASKTENIPVQLSKAQAPIDIYSTPSEAEVYADSGEGRVFLGKTPIQKKAIDFGMYMFSLEKAGFFSKELRLRVDGKKTVNIEAALVQKPASLRISTDPNNARVIVDGVYRGNAPVALKDLEPGSHRVEASTSYGARSIDIELMPDEEKEVSLAVSKPALSFISAAIISALSLLLFLGASGN